MSDIEDLPFVSVVVPFYGHGDRLRRCLVALQSQSYPRDRREVIVVDNGAPERVVQVATGGFDVTVLRENRSGSYAARNKGIRHCKGEIIAFTDSDCIVRRDWIQQGSSRLRADSECHLVGGRVDLCFKSPASPNVMEIYDALRNFKQKDTIQEESYAVTANLVTLKRVFDDVGCFSETWMSRGDKEWCQRAVRKGYVLCYHDDLVVKHPARSSFSETVDKSLRVAGGVYNEDRQAGSFLCRYLRRLIIGLLPPLGRVRLLKQESMVRGKGIQLFLLMWLMKLLQLAEYTRLALGGRTRR